MSDQVAAPEGAIAFVTDARGRKIELRELGPDDMLNLIEAGGEAASNSAWLRYAATIASAAAIDGIPAPPLGGGDKGLFLSFAKRLGNAGLVAVGKHLYGADVEKTEANADAEVAVAKN